MFGRCLGAFLRAVVCMPFRFVSSGLRLLPLLLVAAAPVDPTPGLLRAALPVVVTLDGAAVTLEGLVVRPDRPGKVPLVVMFHGTPRSEQSGQSEARARVSPALFNTAAVMFARHGYATVSVMRRGFGRSGGRYAEGGTGRCDTADYLPAARAAGEDVVAATAALRREPWVDPERVVLLGQSSGGMAVSAAAAAGVPGVRGVLDFAGGRGSSAPDTVCNPAGLVQTFGTLGRTALVPALWLYAENDHFFGPALARRMHAAYTEAGAPAGFVALPAFGADGHATLTAAEAEAWWPSVAPFLARIGLPTAELVRLPELPRLQVPRDMGNACLAGFRAFEASRTPGKAFAVRSGGGCGWATRARDADEAAAEAMERCATRGGGCTLYARGHGVVP